MAPSRRKGASKAAAATAARRRWKVGDLVLAKVKGFPAWPATVSEPEKWGYSTDWKKVFVYFFGTQQIGFCNPADVEPFTEEKKESLLVKHQGKGADFVRSVQEIIDSYEKSKKKDQSDVINSGNEVTQTNDRNSTDSSIMNVLKDEAEVSVEILDSRLNASNSARDRSDLSAEDAVKQIDSLLEKENLQEKPNESVEETPLLAAYTSRKRSGGSRQQNSVAQRRAAPVRRSRSSSGVEPAWFQNFVMPPSNEAANGVRDRSRRNKRIRKSPEDISDFNDGGSTALASNVSPIESEIVTVESDSLSPNEGRSVDSGCILEHPETVEYLERDLELSKGLDLQIQAVVIRKKRKPNREVGMIEATERTAIPDKEAGLEGGVNDTGQTSQYICEKADERNSKEDGDAHLPLVKRARVRMSKPVLETIASASSVEELNSLSQVEEKLSNEGAISSAGQISSALNCDSKGTTERISFLVKGTSDMTSSSKDCTPSSGNWGHLWKLYKNQSSGCFADGEAALPPSKRINRALEAMSANVAEEGQAIIEASLTSKTSINGCCVSPMSRCPDTAVQSGKGKGLGLENVDCSAENYSQIAASGFFTCSNAISSLETTCSVGVRASDKPTEDFKRAKKNFDKDFAAETIDNVDGNDLIAPSAGTVQTVVSIESPGSLLPDLVRGQANPTSNQDSSDQLFPTNDEGGSEDIELINCRAENSDKECVTSEDTRLCPDIVQGVGEVAKVSPGDDTNLQHCRSDGTGCENIESLKSQVDENCQVNGMCEVVSDKEELKGGQKDRSYASVSSDDRLSDKVTSDVQSSPCPIDGVDSPTRVPSPSTLTCHISTSESANFPKSNGCSSPSLLLDQNKSFVIRVADEEKSEPVVTERPKLYSKWNNYAEAQSALSSFEAILGTLTGKKESIGRATRTAMNCGKWGVAAKVVEVLARNLESESSLHRRVDMFFLVDSITQCSQNMKGDVGGMYLSAIQSLLPRLLSAAAPPGSTAQENRRQCLKVLRVWLDRRILPESVVRYHIRELDSHGVAFSAGAYSRRSLRTERSLDDPVREMDGMLVDEYGSNSSFQLPGFCMPRMLKGEGEVSDSDEESFEAVTPEHKPDTPEEQETTRVTEKHRHILEDVDGELEMEDVAPSCDVEMNAGSAVAGVSSSQSSHDRVDLHFPRPFAPPPPRYVLPSSPPPPPPPPSLPPQRTVSNSYSASHLRSGTNNMQDDSRQPVEQHSVAPRMNRTSDAARYHAPECRDHHMHRPIPDSASTFGSFSGRPANNVRNNDGARFHSKPYPPQPPHLAPSDQFSYIQVEHRVKSRREVPPPSFHKKFHGTQNMGGGNFHSNLDRFKPPPYDYESCENWRFHGPSFSGPRYPVKGKTYYPHDLYTGPSREPTRLHNQGWSYPPRDVHHRNSMPMRHPYEAPNFWRRR